jgi:glucose/arabinose dehydrogenase
MTLQRMLLFLVLLLMGCAAPTTLVPTTTPPPIFLPATPLPTSAALTVTFTPGVTPTLLPVSTPTLASVTRLPDPQAYSWQVVGQGFERPLDLVESEGLLVVEQAGRIRWLVDGKPGETPFLDLSRQVSTGGSEQGLLGVALHPNYAINRLFYVNYTDRKGDTVIAQFQAVADGRVADPQTERVLLRIDQPYANHNGGGLAFGPDGFLYIALGDGGSAGDPQGNAQNPQSLLGKLLRIAVDGQGGYAIPFDNPFAGGGGRAEIWALGLRNPWRFSFDRWTGDLYIADVGQNQWEEINFLPAGSPGGANFGWDFREGLHPYEGQPSAELTLIGPVWEYAHDQGCSVTGGFVYRGVALPEWLGVYLAADYCRGTVWGMLPAADGWQMAALFDLNENISAFGQDAAGEIYALGHQTGQIFRLERR